MVRLLTNLNPQNLKGEARDLYGHQFVCLNPNHPDKDTPQQIRDWLDLIYQSIHSNLSPEERTKAKDKEAARGTVAKIENRKAFEIAKNLISGHEQKARTLAARQLVSESETC